MNRLFYLPRANTLNELCQKYPPETKKDVEQREKREILERIQLRNSSNSLPDVKKKVLIAKGKPQKRIQLLTFCSVTRT